MKKFLCMSMIALLAGCATTYPSSPDPHWGYRTNDASSLRGMAGVRFPDEFLKVCSDVWLFPRTPYFERALASNALPLLSPSDRALVRHVKCDGEGDFDFDHLPAQEWIVATYVPYSFQNGVVMTRLASSRVGTEDEIFLYASDSDIREFGSLAPERQLVRTRRVLREHILPWGHQGDK